MALQLRRRPREDRFMMGTETACSPLTLVVCMKSKSSECGIAHLLGLSQAGGASPSAPPREGPSLAGSEARSALLLCLS